MSAGSFTQESLPMLLRDLAERNNSGRCQLQAGPRRATLHFLSHQVVAAETERHTAEAAVRDLLTWLSGSYQFYTEQVLLAHIPRVNRVRQSLQRLLSAEHDPNLEPRGSTEHGIWSPPTLIDHEASAPPAAPLEPPRAFASAEALVSEDHEAVSAEFIQTLQTTCTKLVGPVGKLLLQDAASMLGVNLERIRLQDVTPLLETLKLELPERVRVDFQSAVQSMARRFGAQNTTDG
jgi:Domain of unknown function (DUF4388)